MVMQDHRHLAMSKTKTRAVAREVGAVRRRVWSTKCLDPLLRDAPEGAGGWRGLPK